MRISPLLVMLVIAAACGDNKAAPEGDGGGSEGSAIDAPSTTDTDGSLVDGPAAMTDAAVGVTCGPLTCNPGQDCCVQGAGQTCVAPGTCTGVVFACDGSEDCTTAGQVCCIGGPGGGSTCEAAASCQTPTCVVATDCPHPNQECCAVGVMHVCANQCPGP
jgi:hypothetical protein